MYFAVTTTCCRVARSWPLLTVRVAKCVVTVVRENRANLIVLGIGPHRHVGPRWGRTLETLVHRAPCEVVFDKLPT